MKNRIPEILGLAFLALIVLVLCQGCAETQADFSQHKVFRDPDSGLIVYEKTTDTGAFARAPSNAASPTTQSVGENGVAASVSGVHATTPEQIVAQNQAVLYWIGAGFLLIAIAGFSILKSKPLAVGAGVAAGVCFILPTFLNEVRPYIVPLVTIGVLAFVAGSIWYLAKRHDSNKSSKLAASRLSEAIKAAEAGRVTEALDFMRSGVDALALNKPVFAKELEKGS